MSISAFTKGGRTIVIDSLNSEQKRKVIRKFEKEFMGIQLPSQAAEHIANYQSIRSMMRVLKEIKSKVVQKAAGNELSAPSSEETLKWIKQ
jgi:hypothetical protein